MHLGLPSPAAAFPRFNLWCSMVIECYISGVTHGRHCSKGQLRQQTVLEKHTPPVRSAGCRSPLLACHVADQFQPFCLDCLDLKPRCRRSDICRVSHELLAPAIKMIYSLQNVLYVLTTLTADSPGSIIRYPMRASVSLVVGMTRSRYKCNTGALQFTRDYVYMCYIKSSLAHNQRFPSDRLASKSRISSSKERPQLFVHTAVAWLRLVPVTQRRSVGGQDYRDTTLSYASRQ